jgi:hypothetical protein
MIGIARSDELANKTCNLFTMLACAINSLAVAVMEKEQRCTDTILRIEGPIIVQTIEHDIMLECPYLAVFLEFLNLVLSSQPACSRGQSLSFASSGSHPDALWICDPLMNDDHEA